MRGSTPTTGRTYQKSFRAGEAKARAAKLGIWSARCAAVVPPVVGTKPTTATKPTVAPRPFTNTGPTPKATTGSCTIKGNISSKGEKIYHVPGQRHYEKTVITPSKGERWFCTEAEARSAGWRASKV